MSEGGKYETFCHADRLNAGDISLPFDEGELRTILEDCIRFLANASKGESVMAYYQNDVYRIRPKNKAHTKLKA